ncbi:MAG: cyclic nucleotide-binding domain-containing protein, partial [Parcubacteria group bacterium]|nr:cyclic nucleotide-binding domain-containing protein [Parcubacteria group bacterium]
MMETADLQSIPLFAGLAGDALEALAGLASEQRYAIGKTVYAAGEPSENLYVVVRGSVAVTHQLDGDLVTLARLSQGYFFGEAGLLKDNQTHSSSARAEVDGTAILALSRKNFRELTKRNPSAALALVQKVASVLSERLTEDTTRIAIISAI